MVARRSQLRLLTHEEQQKRTSGQLIAPDLDFHVVPEDLDEVGAMEWARIARALSPFPGRLLETDRAALESYCMWFALWRSAAAEVAKFGVTVAGRSSADAARGEAGVVKNPAIQVMRDAAGQLRYWCRELGFTPDARGRMGLLHEEPFDPNAEDPFD